MLLSYANMTCICLSLKAEGNSTHYMKYNKNVLCLDTFDQKGTASFYCALLKHRHDDKNLSFHLTLT